jgi:large subunit ribosomal protein L10
MLNKVEKENVVKELSECFTRFKSFYVVNPCGLASNDVNFLRKKCFENRILYKVAKNSLIKKSLSSVNLSDVKMTKMNQCLKDFSGIFFLDEDKISYPANFIKDEKKINKKFSMQIKFASIEGDLFFGSDQINVLSNLKSRKEIIGSIVASCLNPICLVIKSVCDSKV